MRFRTPASVLTCVAMLGTATAADEDTLVQDSRAAAKDLGETLESKLMAALGEGGPVHKVHELYPQDQARGFKPGDLRGAFTVSRKLQGLERHLP